MKKKWRLQKITAILKADSLRRYTKQTTIRQTQQEKGEKNQIKEIRNENEVTIDNTEIQKIIRDYYDQLHANNMDNFLEEMDKFLERYNLLKLNQEEI